MGTEKASREKFETTSSEVSFEHFPRVFRNGMEIIFASIFDKPPT